MGFYLWSMSDFQRMPTQDEVNAFDPRWFGDMQLAHEIYAHKQNQTLPMQLAEQLMGLQDQTNIDEDAWRRGDINILEYIERLKEFEETGKK